MLVVAFRVCRVPYSGQLQWAQVSNRFVSLGQFGKEISFSFPFPFPFVHMFYIRIYIILYIYGRNYYYIKLFSLKSKHSGRHRLCDEESAYVTLYVRRNGMLIVLLLLESDLSSQGHHWKFLASSTTTEIQKGLNGPLRHTFGIGTVPTHLRFYPSSYPF